MNIALRYIGDERKFTPDTLYREPLGGIQTRNVLLGRELGKHHTVYVFTPDENGGVYDGVYYINHDNIRDYIDNIDLIIGYSHIRSISDPIVHGIRNKIFYVRHGKSIASEEDLRSGIPVADVLVGLSNWARDAFKRHVHNLCDHVVDEYLDRMRVIPGCIDSSTIEHYTYGERQKNIVYISVPNRGLKHTRRIMELIGEIDSDIKLHVYSGWSIYGPVQPWIDANTEFYEEYRWMSDTSNIVMHDPVPYYRLMDILSKSMGLLYPSITDEAGCAAMQMSMAAGLPCFTTYASGLVDNHPTNRYSLPYNSDGITEDVCREHANNVCSLLNNRDEWTKESNLGKYLSRRFEAGSTCSSWLRLIDEVTNV